MSSFFFTLCIPLCAKTHVETRVLLSFTYFADSTCFDLRNPCWVTYYDVPSLVLHTIEVQRAISFHRIHVHSLWLLLGSVPDWISSFRSLRRSFYKISTFILSLKMYFTLVRIHHQISNVPLLKVHCNFWIRALHINIWRIAIQIGRSSDSINGNTRSSKTM